MKTLINSLVFLTLALASTNSFSYDANPKIFIAELLSDAIGTLSDKKISKSDKKKKN